MNPTFFETPAAFRAWLEKHHTKSTELLVGFRTKGSGRPSLTWPESVDQALCFGWIDGVRRNLDAESYVIRFTPRRETSKWSAINIKKVADLTAQGLMRPAGIKVFECRSEEKSRTYSYEQRKSAKLDAASQRLLEADKKAWEFFRTQAPSYRRTATYWVVSAKADDTRLRRLKRLIDCSARGKRVY